METDPDFVLEQLMAKRQRMSHRPSSSQQPAHTTTSQQPQPSNVPQPQYHIIAMVLALQKQVESMQKVITA